MIGFDIWWLEQGHEETLAEEGFAYEEILKIKEIAESEYERGYREGLENT